MMSGYHNLQKELQQLKNSAKAKTLACFFKTGPGEYGEGDNFLGLTVPQQRQTAKQYQDLGLTDLQKLLRSKIHEYRLTALLILVYKYEKAKPEQKEKIANFYRQNIDRINNWDLVDLTAPKILGDYLINKDRTVLYKLAKSQNLWEKRIAIISTFAFIRRYQLKDTLAIAEILLQDKHDLIHKAVGWMLREVGKKEQIVLENFLQKHARVMPRTMLRYSIEKLDDVKRKHYLSLKKEIIL